MTKKEAIEILSGKYEMCISGDPKECERTNKAIDMAIEALKKQMPKKAELDVEEDLICPVCGSDVEWKRYCEECGQRIDTGDES